MQTSGPSRCGTIVISFQYWCMVVETAIVWPSFVDLEDFGFPSWEYDEFYNISHHSSFSPKRILFATLWLFSLQAFLVLYCWSPSVFLPLVFLKQLHAWCFTASINSHVWCPFHMLTTHVGCLCSCCILILLSMRSILCSGPSRCGTIVTHSYSIGARWWKRILPSYGSPLWI